MSPGSVLSNALATALFAILLNGLSRLPLDSGPAALSTNMFRPNTVAPRKSSENEVLRSPVNVNTEPLRATVTPVSPERELISPVSEVASTPDGVGNPAVPGLNVTGIFPGDGELPTGTNSNVRTTLFAPTMVTV